MIEIIPNWHPIFVHFTVALLSTAVILHLLVRFIGDEKLRTQWETVAQWNLWIGTLITVLTVAMGVVAYNTVAHDTPSHEAMTEHRNWALATALLFLVLAVWSALRARAGNGINTVILFGLLVGGGLLLSTAWHGGEAVYRYGLGVMSLPKADAHNHASAGHHHADNGGAHEDDGHHTHAAVTAPTIDDVENCELPEKPQDAHAAHEHDEPMSSSSSAAETVTSETAPHHHDGGGHDDHPH